MKSISSLLVLLLFIVSVVFCYQHESVVSRAMRTRRNERKREEPPSCASHSCASVNQACGWAQIEDVYFITNCNGGAVCNTTSSSEDNVQGKCVKTPKLGEACVALKGRCEDGYICDYDNDKCVLDAPEISSYPPGHECTNDPFVACYFHNNTNKDVVSSCVDGYCYFTPDWEPCFHTPSECHSTLSYCSACDVCTPYLYLGDECDSANDACNLHFYETCYPSNTSSTFGTCNKFHKGTQNQACTSDEHCAEGYFCPESEEGERLKTCQQFSKNTNTINQPCTSNDDCTDSNGEICSCVNGTTVCAVNDYNVGFWDAFVDVEICGNDNSQCYAANGDYNQSCFAHSCQKELCKFTSVVGTDFFLSASCELHGVLSSLCSSDSSSSPSSSSSSSSTTSTTSSLSSSSEELDAIQSFASILTVTPLLMAVALVVLFM